MLHKRLLRPAPYPRKKKPEPERGFLVGGPGEQGASSGEELFSEVIPRGDPQNPLRLVEVSLWTVSDTPLVKNMMFPAGDPDVPPYVGNTMVSSSNSAPVPPH